ASTRSPSITIVSRLSSVILPICPNLDIFDNVKLAALNPHAPLTVYQRCVVSSYRSTLYIACSLCLPSCIATIGIVKIVPIRHCGARPIARPTVANRYYLNYADCCDATRQTEGTCNV